MNELEKLREYEARYEAEIIAAWGAVKNKPPGSQPLSRLAMLLSDCKKAIAEQTLVRPARTKNL